MIGPTGLLVIVVASFFVCGHSAYIDHPSCELRDGNKTLHCEEWELSQLKVPYHDIFAKVVRLEVRGWFEKLSVSKKFTSLITINIEASLTELSGIDLPDSLVNLRVQHNRLTSLDIGSFPANLRLLDASYNLISEVDLSTLPLAMDTLNLEFNEITSLDLKQFIFDCRQKALNLNMLNNPITCSCPLVYDFMNAVQYKRIRCEIGPSMRCFQCEPGSFQLYGFYSSDAGILSLKSDDAHAQRCLQ